MYAAQSRRWVIVGTCARTLVQLEHLWVKLTTAISTLFLIRHLWLNLDWMWRVRQLLFTFAIEACTKFLVLWSITDCTISVDCDGNPFLAFVPNFAFWASYWTTIPCISIYAVSKTTSNVCTTGLQIAHRCSWCNWGSETAWSGCSAARIATLSNQFTIRSDFNLSLLALNE